MARVSCSGTPDAGQAQSASIDAEIRYLEELIGELAKGKAMEEILRRLLEVT